MRSHSASSSSAFTAGRDHNELDKRLASELMGAHPCVFLDNVNGTALKSDALASAITECPSSNTQPNEATGQ